MATEPAAPPRRWSRDPLVWAILAVFLALAFTYNFTMALGHAPDESSRHFPYVKFLATHWSLPLGDEATEGGALDIHPPLYYGLLTPVYLVFRSYGDAAALRALRLTSPPLILLALVLWLPVIARACGQRRGPTLFAFALTAWWPHLFVPAGALNNDVGLIVMSALLLYLVVVRQWEDRSWRSAALWGAVVGVGTLMKTSGLPPGLALIGVALLLQHGRGWWRDGRFWTRLACGLGAALAVCGWWMARNYLLYGELSPVPVPDFARPIPEGFSKLEALFAGLVGPLLLRAVSGLWASVWAQIGWFDPALEPVVYTILRVVTGLAAIGWVWALVARRGRWPALASRPALVLPLVGFSLLLALALYIATFVHLGVFQGGRYLLPFLPGLTVGLTLGLRQTVPARLRFPLAVCFLLFMLALSPLAWHRLITYWNPLVLGQG
jgi:hypothetical protein